MKITKQQVLNCLKAETEQIHRHLEACKVLIEGDCFEEAELQAQQVNFISKRTQDVLNDLQFCEED